MVCCPSVAHLLAQAGGFESLLPARMSRKSNDQAIAKADAMEEPVLNLVSAAFDAPSIPDRRHHMVLGGVNDLLQGDGIELEHLGVGTHYLRCGLAVRDNSNVRHGSCPI